MTTRLLLWCYQILLVPAGLAALVWRLLWGRPVPGWRQRLGVYPRELREGLSRLRRPIWIHMVSVGEVMAAQPLIQELRRRFPDRDWVLTTVTPTGRSVAQRLLRGPGDRLLYLPWDLAPVVRRVIRRISPSLFISFETELWPLLFHSLSRAKVPILVVNGRISPAAYRRYLWVRPFLERTLACVTFFLTQSPQDARRYAAIGAPKDRIAVTGNLKWDLQMLGTNGDSAAGRFPDLERMFPGLILWTAGSTHPGEEGMILTAYRNLKGKFPRMRLLIAPRHPERVPEVERIAGSMGLGTVRRSRLEPAVESAGADPIILLDTLGELLAAYGMSDLVFVGGSLVPRGGHNLIEPAVLKKPILTGPHLDNFTAIAESLRRAGGIAVVRSAEELERAAGRLLADPAARQALGARAYGAVQEHRGAVGRTVEVILKIVR
ncbi:MAG: 3-deoxy-D-manno-octulosonic acid transferase [Candidatus Omnitrophica bacterium]|nr:3-deoxy-D-manno-octulosonic acid transferase [Candidatus Omnitrophota bacterium]